MPPVVSSAELLTLHAVRLRGVADSRTAAARFGLDREAVSELLLDFEAHGWVRRVEFADAAGWTLTDAGRSANERRLAAELGAAPPGAKDTVARVHHTFLPLNARLQNAVTRWQLRPLPGAPLAANDHTDARWDDRVVAELGTLGRLVGTLCADLSAQLARFDGYADRYATAAARVERGEHRWVDGIGINSCHAVWMELHEDLIATLGIRRGEEA